VTTLGLRFSAETRAKMSVAHQGRVKTPEHLANIARAATGRKHTPETRAKLSEAAKRRRHSPETRARMSASHKGQVKTPEHCAAISAAKKGVPQAVPQSIEQREKNRQAQLGNKRTLGSKRSAEARVRHSAMMRQRWLNGVFDPTKSPTRGKPGDHAGVRMRCLNSEGVFAQQLDEVGIAWVYEPRRFKLSWCTYLPDFYLPEFDIWVEVKGFMSEEAQQKIDTFRRETGKTLVVVFQTDLPVTKYQGRQ